MSKPFPFPTVSKNAQSFDPFIEDVLTAAVDLHRVVAEFQLVSVPSSASASGAQGMVSYDSDYLYVCVSANTWKRVALSTW